MTADSETREGATRKHCTYQCSRCDFKTDVLGEFKAHISSHDASPPSPAAAPEIEELCAEAERAVRLLRIGADHADVHETTEHIYRASAAIIERLTEVLRREVRTLQGELADSRSFANRWIKAALYATPIATLAFDPTDPEAFAESRRAAVDQLLADAERLAALQGELEEMRRRLDRERTMRWREEEYGRTMYLLARRFRRYFKLANTLKRLAIGRAALSSKTETPE